MSLYLTEQGIEHERVHLLTGWDSEITMDYLRGELTCALGRLEERTHEAAQARWKERLAAWLALPIDEKINRRADTAAARAGKPPTAYHPPAWFQAPIGRGGCWPIDKNVAWSRTTRGGRVEDRQVELFANHNPGCMRWGLCETDAAGDGAKGF